MPTADELASLRAIQDAMVEGLRKSREIVQVGQFVACFHATDDLCWCNQAVPIGNVAKHDVEMLIDAYVKRGRSPWLEFTTDLWPDVAPVLEAAGITYRQTMPLMVLRVEDWTAQETEARSPMSDFERRELRRVTTTAFGMEYAADSPLPPQTALEAICLADGKVVSGGQAFGSDKIREVAGLGTDPEYRRRGYCTEVIRALTNAHFESGGEIAWLTPGNDAAQSVYEAAGFQKIATQVAYGMPG